MEHIGSWIFCKSLFAKEDENTPDYEEMGIKGKEELESVEFRFNLKELSSYNPGSERKPLVIRLKNGNAFNLDIPFIEFDKFMKEKLTRKVMNGQK